MSQARVLVDSAASATLATTAVVPVLNGAVTGTGDATAAMVTLSDLATFFIGIDGPFAMTAATATPSAYSSTQFIGFSSTISGAVIMGYGSTNDVTLMNRAGTVVLGVTGNTTGVVLAGALAITGALSGVTTLAVAGAVSGVTTLAASGLITSTASTGMIASATATATPSAYAATQSIVFASTVSGAALMGFGTTNDVSLMNRAGTVVLGVGPNTTLVNIPASLSVGTTALITGVLTATAGLTSVAAATLKSGTAVPATAGAVAAGAPAILYSGALTFEATSDVPTHARPKGSICINTGGGSGITRIYIATDGAGTWTPFTCVG